MSIRRSWLLLLAVLIPAGARADTHKIDVVIAVSLTNGSMLKGLHLTVGKTIPEHTKVATGDPHKRYWSVMGDVSVHFIGGHTKITAMVGPRYTPSLRNLPSPHLGVGFQLDSAQPGFRSAAGVGAEWEPLPWTKEPTEKTEGRLRLQGDLFTLSSGGFNYRVSTGLAVHFAADDEKP